jgi:hypothetical protein
MQAGKQMRILLGFSANNKNISVKIQVYKMAAICCLKAIELYLNLIIV